MSLSSGVSKDSDETQEIQENNQGQNQGKTNDSIVQYSKNKYKCTQLNVLF